MLLREEGDDCCIGEPFENCVARLGVADADDLVIQNVRVLSRRLKACRIVAARTPNPDSTVPAHLDDAEFIPATAAINFQGLQHLARGS